MNYGDFHFYNLTKLLVYHIFVNPWSLEHFKLNFKLVFFGVDGIFIRKSAKEVEKLT